MKRKLETMKERYLFVRLVTKICNRYVWSFVVGIHLIMDVKSMNKCVQKMDLFVVIFEKEWLKIRMLLY